MIRYKQLVVSGAAGIAQYIPAYGWLDFVRVTYTNGQAGGDLTLTDVQTGISLLALTNHNTSFAAAVRKQAVDQAGSAITGEYERVPFSGGLQLETAQQASNTVVTVDIWWIE